jgi:hypothetical protein
MNLGRTSTGSTQCVMGIIAQSFAGDSILMGDLFLKVRLLHIYAVVFALNTDHDIYFQQNVYTTFSFADNAVGFANLVTGSSNAAPVLALTRGGSSASTKRSLNGAEEILLERSEPSEPVAGVLRHKRASRTIHKL